MTLPAHSGLFVVVALGLAGCGGSAPEGAPPAPVALVELQPAAAHTVNEILTAYGTAEFVAADATTIAVAVESRVTELLVTAGAEVKRGQALLLLSAL